MECTERRLFVAWRSATGQIVPIGELLQIEGPSGSRYEFAYLKMAEAEIDQYRLPGFPDLHRRYASTDLFATFANRVMPRNRDDYDAFVSRLGLCVPVDPFEVMERSGGRRQTDRIEVFGEPALEQGNLCSLFFLRGIRHIDGAEDRVTKLTTGQTLGIRRDEANPVNPLALTLLDDDSEVLGYLPDYLVDTAHELQDLNGAFPTITVEHINDRDTPFHMRLLCRLTAQWPDNYEPFASFETIS